MNKEQVLELMKSSNGRQEWRDNCDKVKAACGGDYPDFWYKEVVLSGLADQVCGEGASKITILTGDEALNYLDGK